ncbi:MAG TPA: hypothetical protein VFA23_13095 [Dongiaceae bacterium]|nr:hypothetical protein [Dongiaceae bacterium]
MRLALGAAAALMVTAAVARADDPMQLAVVSYGSIPAGSSFETELFQNTEISNHVDSTLKAALTARGFRYAPGGQGLVFSISADPTGRNDPNRTLGANDPNHAQVHIAFNTAPNQNTDTLARGYRISLSVYERQSGHYVWRAEINDLKPDADPMDATRPMVDKLMSALEKSVKPVP